jgi:DNA modification methylase
MQETLDAQLYGLDLFGEPVRQPSRGKISDKFLVPPFSILSARDGFWQDRKRSWVSLGIQSEVGRNKNLGNYSQTCSLGNKDTSIFDPVICELAYNWFCPPEGQILDPFAGGSVRGIVASILNFDYYGIDLRAEQIAANEEQAQSICDGLHVPVYKYGDSLDLVPAAPECDFIFSCPPYGDLEVYSDDPRDLSTMEYHTFIAAYKRIIARACSKLRQNRFACFVVGDFRDSKGFYRCFPSDTIQAFSECGLKLYNEAILVTHVGSASMRVNRQFDAGRKLAKTHQNILVFCKGDPMLAAREINPAAKE